MAGIKKNKGRSQFTLAVKPWLISEARNIAGVKGILFVDLFEAFLEDFVCKGGNVCRCISITDRQRKLQEIKQKYSQQPIGDPETAAIVGELDALFTGVK